MVILLPGNSSLLFCLLLRHRQILTQILLRREVRRGFETGLLVTALAIRVVGTKRVLVYHNVQPQIS